MQKTANKAKSSSSYTRPKLQKSATLSRKYVHRPTAKKVMDIKKPSKKTASKPKVQKVAVKISTKAPVAKTPAKVQKKVSVKNPVKTPVKTSAKTPAKVSSKKAEPKNAAFKTKAKAAELKKAISSSSKRTSIKVNKIERVDSIKRFNDIKVAKKPTSTKRLIPVVDVNKLAKTSTKGIKSANTPKDSPDIARLAMKEVAAMDSSNKPMKKRHGARFFIAIGCSAAAVAGLATFVVVNIPNISIKVASLQTGIDARYPDFAPRGYSMETVATDKDNKITMKFVGPNDAYFILTEENSTWDSTAVLNNYVKFNYSANYSTMHEQGITYYSDSGSAAWVNGGVLYKLDSFGKNLTREQIRNLVVSL